MFSGKFFLAEPSFAQMLDESFINETPRDLKLSLAMHRFLTWFQMYPALESVKLVAVALVEHEKVPFSVRIKHHVKLVTAGATCLTGDVDTFVLENLPYKEMGNGFFELKRTDPVVVEFFNLVANPEDANVLEVEYRALVAKAAMYMDTGFEPFSLIHDIGTTV